MNRFASLMARLVLGAPVAVLAVLIVLTGVFGTFATRTEMATGNEAFAPENPQLQAAETIGERFDGGGQVVVQVLVDGEDVVSADGLAAVSTLRETILGTPAADHLVDDPEEPGITSWLAPVEQSLAEQGVDPGEMDDAAVEQAFSSALEQMPEEQAGFVTGLLPDDVDPSRLTDADAGLLLVFLDTEGMVPEGADDAERFEALTRNDGAIADAVRSADLPEGMDAEAFSFNLLFDDSGFESEITRLFGSAFVIILLILGFVYWVRPTTGAGLLRGGRRTVADVVLTMATIMMAILWMNGIGALLGPGGLGWIGPQSEVTQIVPVLMIGLGVDYAIHLTSRYREEVAQGASVPYAIERAVRTVGIALVLATATTAVGFLTNVFNPVPALTDFGVLAAVGIAVSFVLMLTFVPAVRLLLDRRAERTGRLPREALGATSERVLPGLMARVAVLAERIPVATLAVTVLLGGGLGAWGLSQLEFRFSITDFVSDDSPVVATLDEIQERFGGGFGETTDVLVQGEVATPSVHNATVDALGDLSGVDDVATFGDQPQAESVVSLLGGLLAAGPEGGPSSPQLAQAAQAAGVDDSLRVAGDADVASLYDALRETAPEQADRVLARDEAGGYDAARVSIQTRAGESGAGELREELTAVFGPVAATGPTVTLTSDEIITEVITSALSDSQLSSMAITLAAAMLLLLVTYWIRDRRPLLGVITVLPVALVVLWTFAMMAATGIPFGPVTATIAALAIGIGVPYTIHITNRYQEDRLLHQDPADAIRATVRHTGGALAGSAFTTCAGFGILVTSTLTPFRQFGFVTVYAIGFALVAATLVLPSMLTLWDRWHRRRVVEPSRRAPVGA